MTDIFFVKGPQRADKTGEMIKIMHERQKTDGAMSYLFLGSSGGFLHDFRERYLDEADVIFNTNFKVINQFVVEEIRNYLPEKIHVDNQMLSALVLEVLSDNSELKELLNSGIGIVEMFMSFFSIVNEEDPDELFSQADWAQDPLMAQFIGLYSKFRTVMDSYNMFSTYDAYRILSQIILDGQYIQPPQRKYLFIDGFSDLSKPVRDFLCIFIRQFEEVFLTMPTSLCKGDVDISFSEFISSCSEGENRNKVKIHNLSIDNIKANPIDYICDHFLEEELDGFNDLISPDSAPILFAQTLNPQAENRLIGALVKDLVLNKEAKLDEIGIVTRDIKKRGLAISRVFDEMGIPYRFEGDVNILESMNVNKLILPFRIFYTGFDPEMILNYIEAGFVDTHGLSFASLQSIFNSAGLLYGKKIAFDGKLIHSNHKSRKRDWTNKLERYKSFMKERLQAHSASVEEEKNLRLEMEETLQNIESVEGIVKDVFETLGTIFASMKKRDYIQYHEYFKFLYNRLNENQLLCEDEFEQISIEAFFEDVLPSLKRFFSLTRKSDNPQINPAVYWKYLNIFLQNKSFHSSEFIENRCMIMDMEASRYRSTEYRIYTDFLDGNYPKLVINKVYDQLMVNGTPYIDSTIMREERDFILSLRKTGKKAMFVYPQGDINGNPYNRSFYVDRLLKIVACNETEQKKYFLNTETIQFSQDYSINDFLISRLDKIDVEDEGFIKLCSEFDYDWPSIKTKVQGLKENLESSFLIDDKNAIEELFGDTLSASKYSVMKKCYKDFFYRYIMKVKSELFETEGFDYLVEGQILHAVLHFVFSLLTERELLLENMKLKDFESFFNTDVIGLIKNEIKAKMFHPEKVLFDAEVSYFSRLIKDFLEKYRASDYIFSNPDPESYGSSVFIPKEFEIEIKRENQIRFMPQRDIFFIGKIDRLDIAQSGEFFIYDYKRSQSSAKKENAHQLMMYAYACKQMFKTPMGMAFLPIISKTNKITGLSLKYCEEDDLYIVERARKDKEMNFDDILEDIKSKVEKVFSGDFRNVESVNCYRCPHIESGLCEIRNRVDLR